MIKNLRLGTKMGLIIALTLTAVIGTLGYLNVLSDKRELFEVMAASSGRTAQVMSDGLERYMPKRETDKMQSTMDMILAEQPDIRKLALINKAGRVILSTDKNEIGTRLSRKSRLCMVCHTDSSPSPGLLFQRLNKLIATNSGQKVLTVINPIYNKRSCYESSCHFHSKTDRVLGLLKIDFSMEEMNRRVLRRGMETVITALVAIVVLTLVMRFFVGRTIGRPVGKVLAGMKRVASGDLGSRIDIDSRDEIGQLARGFNRMTVELSANTRELRETRDYLLGIVENSADLIITVNTAGTIETFNRGAERILGYDRSEVIGKRIEMLFARPEERDAAIRQLQYRDNVVNYETQFLRKDGTPVDIILTLSRLRDPEGNPVGTFGISKDVTEYKRLQNQLIQSQCLAAIGEAIAGIVHSMKNILNSLKGGSYMIKTGFRKNDIELVQEGWEVAQKGIDRITELAMDMLDFTRRQKASAERCSINEIVSESCAAMSRAEGARGLVDLTCELEESLPPVHVDRKAVFHAVMNLISNAVEACIEREYESGVMPWVKVRTYREGGNGHACIEVTDNGGGIPDGIRENIFHPFFSTKLSSGTGLGLAITMKTVQEHDGELSFDTMPGEGSRFTMKLPVIRDDPPGNDET